MTAPLPQQTISVKDDAAVRRRKRRAPAGGAADDCFTCSKRNVKCDRRRPYCSQCLEFGNECSGYKTQLTWGVGVASRGKLRGLSLPVAKAPPVSREVKKSPPVSDSHVHSIASVTAAHWVEQQEPKGHQQPQQQQHRQIEFPSVVRSDPTSANSYSEPGHYDHFAPPAHHDTTPHDLQHSWGNISYSSSLLHSPEAAAKFSRLHLPLTTDGMPSSVNPVSNVGYLSPLSQTYSHEEMPFDSESPIIFNGYPGSENSQVTQSPPLGLVLGHHHHHHQQQHYHHARVTNSCPGVLYASPEHSSNLNSAPSAFEAHLSQKLIRECDGLHEQHLESCQVFPF
ncbi:hypothetical protein E4U55_002719 [Claviceps digitariae]|nr:hypothetical protein E4U55_002719 [Claviceps digitariae]